MVHVRGYGQGLQAYKTLVTRHELYSQSSLGYLSSEAAVAVTSRPDPATEIHRGLLSKSYPPMSDSAASKVEVSDKSVYVGNLKFETTEQKIREVFEKYGALTSCRLVTRRDGKSKGFGFVDFEKAEDAKKAIDELNDTDLEGRPILVRLAKPPKQASGENEERAKPGRASEGTRQKTRKSDRS